MLGQIVMCPRVITLFVTRLRGLHHQVRSCQRPLADPEERRPRAVPPQDGQRLRRPLPRRAVIDGERDDPGRRRGAERHRCRVGSGPAGAAVRAVGPSAAAPSQAAIPAPAPTRPRRRPGRPRRGTRGGPQASHLALSQRRQARTPQGPVSGVLAVLQQHHPLHPRPRTAPSSPLPSHVQRHPEHGPGPYRPPGVTQILRGIP